MAASRDWLTCCSVFSLVYASTCPNVSFVPSSSSLIGGLVHPFFTCKRHTTLNASIHFATSSEEERRASPLRLRIDTMRTTSLLLPSTGYPWLWIRGMDVWFTSSNRRGYPLSLCLSQVEAVALNGTYSHCRFIYCNKHGQAPLRMRIDPIFVFADAGTHISDHKRASQVHKYITLHLRQKQGQNAIAHAYGWVCRWWDTYIKPQAC